MVGSVWRRHLGALTLALFLSGPAIAWGQGALSNGSLVDYVRGREDLPNKDRRALEAAVRREFGGQALEEEAKAIGKNTFVRSELQVAKAILSAAIFMQVEPKKAAKAAWEGWHDAQRYVPPPIAIHYQILTLEGRRPRGRSIDLAFHFPDYYNEEIAPELVAYWEEALAAGQIPDDALTETREALDATRVKMRPLLLDKLRLLSRLARELSVANGARRAEILRDQAEVEGELTRAFSKVARRPEVLDPKRRPYDRLRIQLEDLGLPIGDEDKALDPDGAPPPPKLVPTPAEPPPPPVSPEGQAEVEPSGPPVPLIPPQPRPGDPRPVEDPVEGRSMSELIKAYAFRLAAEVTAWLGTPYRWGNATRGVGTDCSGFTRSVYLQAFALDLPRTSRDQYRTGMSVPLDGLRAGDLVFFDTRDVGQVSHVGVYAGEGRFAHASSSRGVVYDKLDASYFRHAYRGARRILAYP